MLEDLKHSPIVHTECALHRGANISTQEGYRGTLYTVLSVNEYTPFEK